MTNDRFSCAAARSLAFGIAALAFAACAPTGPTGSDTGSGGSGGSSSGSAGVAGSAGPDQAVARELPARAVHRWNRWRRGSGRDHRHRRNHRRRGDHRYRRDDWHHGNRGGHRRRRDQRHRRARRPTTGTAGTTGAAGRGGTTRTRARPVPPVAAGPPARVAAGAQVLASTVRLQATRCSLSATRTSRLRAARFPMSSGASPVARPTGMSP